MNDWRNRIYSNLKKSLPEAKVITETTDKPAENNTVYFFMLDYKPLNYDMEVSKENFQLISCQIETYTKTQTEGYELMKKINDIMTSMHFVRIEGPFGLEAMVPFNRLISRFQIMLGSGNEIEKF